jgi:hypothetical protein
MWGEEENTQVMVLGLVRVFTEMGKWVEAGLEFMGMFGAC